MYSAYDDGASLPVAIIYGIVSAGLNMLSVGSTANAGKDIAGMAIEGFADLVFGTGFNSVFSALTKAFFPNEKVNDTSRKSSCSALNVALRAQRNSRTRMIDGRLVLISKKASYPYLDYNADPHKLYCNVRF